MKKRLTALILALAMVLCVLPASAHADSGETINGVPMEEYMVTYKGEVPTYSGAPAEPEAVVSCRNVTLTEGVDYTVSYENNVNVTDEAYIVITGCGDYEGLSLRQAFTIAPYDLSNLGIWAMEVEYSNPLVYPKPVKDDNGNVLVEGVDYLFRTKAVAYSDSICWGCIYGIGNYTGAQSMLLTITYPEGSTPPEPDQPEVPEGEVYTYYPQDGDEDVITMSTPDSIRLLVQTEESKFFTASYSLLYFESETDTDPEVVAEVLYSEADVNTVNDFEYQFLTPGIYGIAAAWAEHTRSSYTGSDGQVIYVQEPNGITGTYSAVIEVGGYDYGTGNGGEEVPMGSAEARYGWIESMEAGITYISPRRILLENVTTPGSSIMADYYDYATHYPAPDMKYDYIYLYDAGSYTFYSNTYEQDDGSYKFNLKWKIDVPEWDILDGGRIESVDIRSKEANVTFGGEVLEPKTDYTLALENVEGTNLVRVTVTCKNLFKGTLSGLYYADTGNPYYCDHDWKGTCCQNCGAFRRNPFTDVPEDSWYIDPVLWALENGITTGATETTFNPNGTCLRAQVVTFLHRAEGSPAPSATENPFTDVKSTDFFYKPVLWAVEESITNGTSATTFGSYDNCNRAAVVTFLWRAAGCPEPETTENPFSDVKPTDFFYKAVLWAVENGITNGVDATHFGPTQTCNRAQVVTFLYRAYQ